MQSRQVDSITIQLNGAEVPATIGVTLGQLLDQRGVERRMIAVEYNGEILPRYEYDNVVLSDGDRLEVVQMVGGG